MITDHKSPIAYGYEQKDIPVYFNQDPVFSASAGGGRGGRGGFGGGGRGGGPTGADALAQNITPNVTPIHISPYDDDTPPTPAPSTSEADQQAAIRQQMRQYGIVEDVQPRVVMTFPQNPNDMLLSGTLAGGQALSGRAAAIDVPLGKGHVVLFALRPFWRWQTQGTYFLGFNTILNWNHLDAGKSEERPQGRRRASQRQ